jgi:hypothetical protein
MTLDCGAMVPPTNSHQPIYRDHPGRQWVLLILAPNTNKTVIAFHVARKVWSSGWIAKGRLGRKLRSTCSLLARRSVPPVLNGVLGPHTGSTEAYPPSYSQ